MEYILLKTITLKELGEICKDKKSIDIVIIVLEFELYQLYPNDSNRCGVTKDNILSMINHIRRFPECIPKFITSLYFKTIEGKCYYTFIWKRFKKEVKRQKKQLHKDVSKELVRLYRMNRSYSNNIMYQIGIEQPIISIPNFK